MNTHRPPTIETNFSELPSDSKERHEMLVDVFGRYLFWLRNWTVDATRQLSQNEETREKLGAMRRIKYDECSAFTLAQQETVYKISEATVDRFIQLFLTMLAGASIDQRLGKDHAFQFKLDIEISNVDNGDVVEKATINRGGKKFFADYWGRWLNQFATSQKGQPPIKGQVR